VARVGEWGKVYYHHILTCGHIEARKRMTRVGGQVACLRCLSLNNTIIKPNTQNTEPDMGYDEMVSLSLVLEANIRAVVSSRLSIPSESIEVVVSPTGATRVTMFLDTLEATTLSRV
jgi:hypothetical protein